MWESPTIPVSTLWRTVAQKTASVRAERAGSVYGNLQWLRDGTHDRQLCGSRLCLWPIWEKIFASMWKSHRDAVSLGTVSVTCREMEIQLQPSVTSTLKDLPGIKQWKLGLTAPWSLQQFDTSMSMQLTSERDLYLKAGLDIPKELSCVCDLDLRPETFLSGFGEVKLMYDVLHQQIRQEGWEVSKKSNYVDCELSLFCQNASTWADNERTKCVCMNVQIYSPSPVVKLVSAGLGCRVRIQVH